MLAIAFYALATLTLGFAHKPVAVSNRAPDFDLAAYQLPDGTLPDLCLGQDGGSPAGKGAVHCDACVLTVAAGLTPPGGSVLRTPDSRVVSPALPDIPSRDSRILSAARSRAPPTRAS